MAFKQSKLWTWAKRLFPGTRELLRDVDDPMGANEVRTSPFVSVAGGPAKLVGSAFSDVAGTLKIQFANQRGGEVVHEETLDIGAGVRSGGFVVDIVAGWVRLEYTNGPAEQTKYECVLSCRAVS